jgi:glycerate 2-kinase
MRADPRPACPALDIALAAVRSVRAGALTARALAGPVAEPVAAASAIYLIAVGKAADEMYGSVRAAAGRRFADGIVVAHRPPAASPPAGAAHRLVGDHPFPGPGSLAAGQAVRDLLSRTRFGPADLVVFAVSGGSSALLALPRPPLDGADIRELYRRLVLSGLDVTRVNKLRAVVSLVHGGALLDDLGDADALALILSDNVQIGPQAVASALTYPDFASQDEALDVVGRLRLPAALDCRVRAAIAGYQPAARRIRNTVVGTPSDVLAGGLARADELGFSGVSLGARLQGNTADVTGMFDEALRHHANGRTCLIGAGETSVQVRGNGIGGRCQELAFSVSRVLRGRRELSFAAVATDGQDYLPAVMGAWADGATYDQLMLSPGGFQLVLENNDTNPHLTRLGQCVAAKPTGTNLCDVYVLCEDREHTPT